MKKTIGIITVLMGLLLSVPALADQNTPSAAGGNPPVPQGGQMNGMPQQNQDIHNDAQNYREAMQDQGQGTPGAGHMDNQSDHHQKMDDWRKHHREEMQKRKDERREHRDEWKKNHPGGMMHHGGQGGPQGMHGPQGGQGGSQGMHGPQAGQGGAQGAPAPQGSTTPAPQGGVGPQQ